RSTRDWSSDVCSSDLDANVQRAQRMVEEYRELMENGTRFEHADVQSFLRILSEDPNATLKGLAEAGRPRSFGKKSVAPKSLNQRSEERRVGQGGRGRW